MKYDNEKIQIKTMHGIIDFNHKDILEIGCGDGSMSLFLAQGAASYTAVDPDLKKINTARALETDIGFKSGSGQNLDFNDESFDLVLFTLSLHHQDSIRALDEAFRMLKPWGRVLVVEPMAMGEFQQFFHLFDNETQALTAAMEAIGTSRFNPVEIKQFHVRAEFNDLQDLLTYDFGRASVLPGHDEKILALLDQLKGERKAGQIFLKDELQLILLKK